jgi:hypothetical protein
MVGVSETRQTRTIVFPDGGKMGVAGNLQKSEFYQPFVKAQ